MPHSPDLMLKASRWAVLSVAAQLVKAVLLFGSQVVLARLLSPVDFGIVAMCVPVFSFLSIFNDLGLSQATVQRPGLTRNESNLIFWMNAGLGLTVAMAIAAVAPAAASFYGDSRVASVLVALSFVILVNSLSSQQIALLVRGIRPVPLLLIEILPVIGNVIASIATALHGFGYWSIVIGQATHAFMAGSIAWIASDFRPSWPRDLRKSIPILRFGAHLTGLSIGSFFAANLSPVLVGRLFGVIQVGLFDRAFKLVSMSYMQILAPISRIAETVLARLLDDDEQYRKAFMQIAEATLLVTLPGLLCIAIQSDAAVSLLYGPKWIDCSPIVSFFAFGSLMTPLGTVATWLMITQGRTARLLKYGLIGNVMSVLSLLVGISWGAVGVALSFAVFSIPIHGLTIWAATRDGPVSLARFTGMLLPIVGAIVAAAVAVFSLSVMANRYGLPDAVEFCGGIAIAYLTVGVALGCSAAGRRVLRDAARIREIFPRRRGLASQ
ncbi:lipopolysaccharide biosynthesis protein [Rhodopseudomonas sp. RCAM05734]|uniref:lipopolysaccharide biosynthesis protein n=1 Tax=Rhodopseudomonas sp. RCAM05734 TaxID=3457549 RepID=UPI0040443CE3